MPGRPAVRNVLRAVVLLAVLRSAPGVLAAADDQTQAKPPAAARTEGTVSGLVMDKHETWMMVKAEGESGPVKYVWDNETDAKTRKTLPAIFVVARVQLTYKRKGDARHLVSIKKKESKATGTVTGVVLGNHQWWVEVKPKNGPTEGYAVHYPFDQHPDTLETVKGLQKGDVVTIRFTTDFERHRIEAIRKHEPAPK